VSILVDFAMLCNHVTSHTGNTGYDAAENLDVVVVADHCFLTLSD